MANGKTAEFIREKNKKREGEIREEMELKIFWECEIREMITNDSEMKKFFEQCHDTGAINLRDGFFGGRTGVDKMYAEKEEGYKIKYVDIQSLYPSVNFYCKYPIDHPEVSVLNRDVQWKTPRDLEYNGIIKCIVVPPRFAKTPPVLPARFDNRLLFPLCRTCSMENKIGKYDPDYSCPHDDEDRAFTVTTTHEELSLALENGYTVTRINRVYQFRKYDDNLFKGYVRQFMQLKIQASGWPEDCKCDNDNVPAEINEKRMRFLDICREKYGINLDSAKMKTNPGIRYISKLCLNSLWYIELFFHNN